MMKLLNKDAGLALLRASFGLLMLFGHGASKMAAFGKLAGSFPDPFGVGSEFSLLLALSAEVGASLLVTLGLLTRWSLLPLLFTMLVAFFGIHGADPFAVKEMALLYAIVYSSLLIAGPGRYSLDHLIGRRHSLYGRLVPA